MTFAAARSLAADLHASVVPPSDINNAVSQLHALLCNFSPNVEPSTSEPGVFWVDPKGMTPLYGSLELWADALRSAFRTQQWRASIVVGFHRYRCYAIARTAMTDSGRQAGMWVIPDLHAETKVAAQTPLHQLGIPPDLRDQLHVLGIRTLGDFLQLPAAELATRFGPEAARLHALASDSWVPLQPRMLTSPVTASLALEPPDDSHTRLLFGLKGTLHQLMSTLAERGQAMALLHLRLKLDHAGAHDEYIEPAAPTLDVPMLIDLVRLRLEALTLRAAVEGVEVHLEGIRATSQQLALFVTRRRRDPDAASRAIARLRAMLGPQAVTRAVLRPAHLPEASFAWEPVQTLTFPDPPAPPSRQPLCRRLLPRPLPLPARPRHEPETWLARASPIVRLDGPYRVSGGWWVRTVERDYYFAETKHGEILWLYYDRPRQRWYLHGFVD